MSLTRNQTAVLTVLARDDRIKKEKSQEWVGRTGGSLISAVSKIMGSSSAYAALRSMVRDGFVDERYLGGRGTKGVKHFVWITPAGLEALEAEKVVVEELASTASNSGATMGSAPENA